MSVGSRIQDDRRRRRLAVSADVTPEGQEGVLGGVALLRARQVDLPAASPLLPRHPGWRVLVVSGFWVALILVAGLLIRPFPPHPQLAPAINHLVDGPRPVLQVYAEILLWNLAAHLAGLIGWFRSQSQLDFRGRYRLWAWPVLVFVVFGFCAGTDIHTAIGSVAGPRLRWPLWRAELMIWLVPCMTAGLSVWWIVGHDVRRSRWNAVLLRCALMLLLSTGAGWLYHQDLAHWPWFTGALVAGQFLGMGLLITGLWLHAHYVAYVCADPPDPGEPNYWRFPRLNWLAVLRVLFRRRAEATADSPEGKARRKKSDDGLVSARRPRKTSTKTKRTTRARSRPPVEEVAAEEEEELAETDEASFEEDEHAHETDESEQEEDRSSTSVTKVAGGESPPTGQTRGSGAAKCSSVTQPPSIQPSQSSAQQRDEDEEEDTEPDQPQYRFDGAHSGVDPFKGLSKRQRRELKRQMREQQRLQQRGH